MVEFRILGPLEVLREGRPVELKGSRPRAVLTLLLLNADQHVSTERLIDELWGAQPPQKARGIVHNAVSDIRRAAESPGEPVLLESQPSGYTLHASRASFDLSEFEQLLAGASASLEAGRPEQASRSLARALAIWRGPPLADFLYEPFATAAAARLEELRMVALERRIEAELAMGQGAELLAELQQLVAEHPLRETLRCQLMLALYRGGRQVEALDQARAWRRHLHDELGIDPGPSVRTLEERILRQASSLGGEGSQAGAELPRAARTVLLWAADDRASREALDVCAPLAATRHELVLVGTAAASADLNSVVDATARRADAARKRGFEPRVAAFVAADAGRDVARLASHLDVALAIRSVGEGDPFAGDTAALLEALPCDVALVRSGEAPASGAVLAAFGGSDHDWAAIELAAWWASAAGTALELFGAEPADGGGASRSLATAAVLIQRLVGVATRPVVGSPGAAGVEQAAAAARLVIVGVSERWRSEGLGETRRRLLADVRAPLMIVRRGVRPGALAPPESLTAYSWSLG